MLAPHTDDGELGCGGTIAKLARQGHEVHYHAFSVPEPVTALRLEVKAATKILGVRQLHVYDFPARYFDEQRQRILELLVEINGQLRPDLVLMPSRGDVHQDHATVAREALRAFKGTTLLGYELPWNCFAFNRQGYVTLEPPDVEAKLKALACYESQGKRPYTTPSYTLSVLLTRGVEASAEHAEAFEIERMIL